MRFDLEEKFVNDYINKTQQDRLLFELKSDKKRSNAVWRFSHNTDSLVKKEKVYLKLQKFDKDQLKSLLNESVYYVISHKYLDGTMMDVNQVLGYIENEHTPVIVYGAKIALIKKEFEKGEDNFYLLK